MNNKINRILMSISFIIFLFPLAIPSEYTIFGQNKLLSTPQSDSIPTEINGIKCDRTEHLQFHNHTLLVINNHSETITVPGGIGIIPDKCLFWLHTHDDSGIIHIESPINLTFTLDHFLQIWDEFDDRSFIDLIANNMLSTNTSILLENNNTLNMNNYKDIVLRDNLVIAIDIQNEIDK